jgi:hypothetical protein
MIFSVLLCIAFSLAFGGSVLWAQPSEDSLIQAWEALQKSDPKIATLEKLGDRRYKFKTEYFPFDGELRIKDAIVGDTGGGLASDYFMGIIEVELAGFSKKIIQQHSHRYSMWAGNNNLYFDKKLGKWLSAREFQSAMITKSNQMSRSTWDIGNYAIILLAGVGLFVSWRILQRYGRTTKLAMQKQTEAMAQSETALQLSEKSVLLAEESNKLLKEIIEVLKSKNRD